MAPGRKVDTENSNGSLSGKTPPLQHSVKDLITWIGKFSSSDSFKELNTILAEHEALETEVRELKMAIKINLNEFTENRTSWSNERQSLTNDLDTERQRNETLRGEIQQKDQALEAEKKNAKEMGAKIQKIDAALRQTKEKLEASGEETLRLVGTSDKLKEELEDARKKQKTTASDLVIERDQSKKAEMTLKETETSLRTFRSYLAPLSPLKDKKAQIHDSLESLFKSAFNLCHTNLGGELDKEVLADLLNERSSGNSHTGFDLPLPPSNTKAARGMRVVFGITVIGTAFCRHIFKRMPLDLTETANEELISVGLGRESFFRAFCISAFPVTRKKIHQEAIQRATSEIARELEPWLKNGQLGHEDLTAISGQACVTWSLIQDIQESIRPCFANQFVGDCVPLPDIGMADGQKTNKATRNASASTGGTLDKCIWPSFLSANPDERDREQLVYPGYCLTSEALKEVETERRTQRRMSRENTPEKGKEKEKAIQSSWLGLKAKSSLGI